MYLPIYKKSISVTVVVNCLNEFIF